MSVYREAAVSGRLKAIGWTPAGMPGRHGRGNRISLKGIRRALREVKRWEAEDRNEHTPHERTRQHRRELAAAAQRIADEKGGRRG